MRVWFVVVVVILFVIAISFGGIAGYFTNQNLKTYENSRLIPFSQTIDPNNPTYNTKVSKKDGSSQIVCPLGTKINIVGAVYEVQDTYNQCSPQPSPLLTSSCIPGVSSGVPCDYTKNKGGSGLDKGSNEGCSPGYTCDESSKTCELRVFNDSKSAGSVCNKGNYKPTQDGGGYVCEDSLICDPQRTITSSTYGTLGANPVCNPETGSGRCAVRDVSAYVASVCDGNNECTLDFTAKSLGPVPCSGLTLPNGGCNIKGSGGSISINNVSSTYCDLPFTYGYPGGVPAGAKPGGPSTSPNNNLGYIVHGIYTCV